jgi:hypothetical protein
MTKKLIELSVINQKEKERIKNTLDAKSIKRMILPNQLSKIKLLILVYLLWEKIWQPAKFHLVALLLKMLKLKPQILIIIISMKMDA